jgi:hypothetical protein
MEAETTRTLVSDQMAASPIAATTSAGKPEAKVLGKSSAKLEATSVPPPVLPDDVGPKARPEDFLPFFQFPGTGAHGGDTVAAPAAPATPGQLPPSTATYEQQ